MKKRKNMRKGKKNRKNKRRVSRKSRITRIVVQVIVAVSVLIFLQLIFNRHEQPAVKQLDYSKFLEMVKTGEVDSLEIKGTIITGVYQPKETEEALPVNESTKNKEKKIPRIFRTTILWGDPNVFLIPLLEKNGIHFKSVPKDNIWTVIRRYLPMLIILSFMVIWFAILMNRASGQTDKIRQHGQSQHREITDKERTRVTFKNVAGVDEAKEELQEIIEFLKNPKKFTRLGAVVPRGVLLIGPPGCGKTLLAQAVAGEAEVPFFSTSGSDFVEVFVGVGASRTRDLFVKAREKAPAIIFIDEIDAVGRHRGAGFGSGHDEREQTLNAILGEMDGFNKNRKPVIVIAATNRPDILDPALLRPGRFDRHVIVSQPDIKGREEILKIHSRLKTLAKDVSLEKIARITPGFSGADLANIMNESALLAARKGLNAITIVEIEEAIDKVTMGPARRIVMTEEDRRVIAYHETGHTLISEKLPLLDKVNKVTIMPRGMALGITQQLPEKDRYTPSKEYFQATMVLLYGGRMAEELVFGPEGITTGAQNDIKRVSEIARKMVCEYGMSEKLGALTFGEGDAAPFLAMEVHRARNYSEETAKLIDHEIKRFSDEAMQEAKKILTDSREQLDKIAQALLEEETLSGEEVRKILKKTKK